ncbi:hypothetical protein PACTADRAFT_47705 [Pachysolen tannophilus NRRL Y-2460]|uniref:ER-derived vesicles protein ERV29 n=1 Tax=Pachysolen tannophilus NRRL Y-2460 TaxID=669874 RepID=A0A1E4U1J6_PACTA|nr:hypothetical protein PACTADRAFT_47705 [Pachysolen tannophilus NRRL Y-2460]
MSYRGKINNYNFNQNNSNNVNSNKMHLGPVVIDKSYIEKFENFTEVVESTIDNYSGPVKPYVPAIGRFLIVATFYEDATRIVTQWKDQVFYLWNYRHMWYWLVVVFLFTNVIVMSSAATMLILRKKTDVACIALCLIVFFQGLVYGLWFDSAFLLRNLSVLGGLLLAFADSLVRDKRALLMPGLPMIERKDNKKYILLAGRVLVIVLFAGFAFNSNWSLMRFLVVFIGFTSSISIVVGYKTKFAAIVLVFLLAVYNTSVNHYWTYSNRDPRRDFLKYEFFQTLSIVGGLLVVTNTGAGELSLDEKKKIY